jgi:hypothetical protein
MKIGILNMQYSRHNYGALLQAAALEHIVRDLLPDAEVKHIDARPASFKKIGGWLQFKTLVRRYVGGLLGRIPKMPQIGNYEVFSDFRDQSLQLTSRAYFECSDFEREQWDYDLVIVGSDQVFRVKFVKSRAGAFFLRFLPSSCRRVSYAASFGVDHWEGADDSDFTKQIGQDLAKFDAISVRESSGVDICNNIFGVEAQHVLDPTLLVGRGYFDEIIERGASVIQPADWSLHCISEDAMYIDEVPGLAKRSGKVLKDIFFSRSKRWLMPAQIHFSSVPDWLMQIRETKELVLTDSFHCVCFSILFEKDFLVFVSEHKGPDRMKSLLGALGLEDRICSSREALESAVSGASPIDYGPVRAALAVARKHSSSFLGNALGVPESACAL